MRRTLVLDPKKRFTIAQIQQHRWMQMATLNSLTPPVVCNPRNDDWNEQILQLMASKGIDRTKTLEVL